MLAHVLHPDRVAQVGLVRPIPFQRIAVGNARPVGVDLARHLADLLALLFEMFEQPLQHRLNGGEDVVLGDEAHLDVQLVEVGGRAVRAGVFIAETGRDLEVTVETCDLDQLLELLRRLGQGVELARMQARRHQKVARALWGRGGDDRRLEFREPLIPHGVAQPAHHVRPQHHVLVHRLAPQVQEAVGQPGFFGVFGVAEDRQWQLFRRAKHLDLGHVNLDLAGRNLGVDQRRIPRLHAAIHPDDPLRPHLLQRREGRRVPVAQKLRDPVMVAQVDEQHPAMVAHPVDPAGKPDGFTHMGLVQRGTGVAAIGVHRIPL